VNVFHEPSRFCAERASTTILDDCSDPTGLPASATRTKYSSCFADLKQALFTLHGETLTG